jgi:zinc protease
MTFRSMVATAMALVAVQAMASAQFKPLAFKEYDLPNGLHVILHEDHSAPVVATVLHYKVGSRDEDPARTGFAHFFEHLMFEATDGIERATIDKMVNGAGGQLNAFTSVDQTVYHFVVPSNQVRLALWIEAQRMRLLHVDKVGVETQRGVVKEERRNRYDNAPYGNRNEKMMRALFAGTPYEWTPIGSAQHIDSAAIPEFKKFYDTYYQPNNAILVISGDFDEALVRQTIDAYFGGYPKAPEPPRPVFAGLRPLTTEVRETINDAKAQLPLVSIGYQGIGMLDEDQPALELLSSIMSSGESSRMRRALVDSERVAVQASCYNQDNEYGGAFIVVGVAAPGKNIADVEKSLDRELQRVMADGVTDDELKKAKNILEASFIEGRMGVYEKALAFAGAYRFNKDTKSINEELARYLKVTKDDIKRVAKRILDTKGRIVLTYMPVKG